MSKRTRRKKKQMKKKEKKNKMRRTRRTGRRRIGEANYMGWTFLVLLNLMGSLVRRTAGGNRPFSNHFPMVEARPTWNCLALVAFWTRPAGPGPVGLEPATARTFCFLSPARFLSDGIQIDFVTQNTSCLSLNCLRFFYSSLGIPPQPPSKKKLLSTHVGSVSFLSFLF